jgi:hypothetical protein
VGAALDHTTIDVIDQGDHDVVVMRDATADLLTPDQVTPERMRHMLRGLADMHDLMRGCALDGMCAVADRYRMFAPHLHADDHGARNHPRREMILAGWEAFDDVAPREVAEAVYAVHADPAPLANALIGASRSMTLVHGDVKLNNLGLRRDRLVAIDWGELTGVGPPEVDLAWFAVMNGWRIGATPDEIIDAYTERAAVPPTRRALDLACIGSVAQMGFWLAEPRVDWGWWVDRVRSAL